MEVWWGRGYFLAGRPRSKNPTPLGILSEENIELFRGGVRANVWRWERERENRNSAALIGMWVDAGGGRLHM